MARVKGRITIYAAPERVMATIADPQLLARWQSPLIRVDPAEWRLRAGARFAAGVRLPGAGDLDVQVVERERHRLTLLFDGFWHGTDQWVVAPAGGGTLVHNVLEFELTRRLPVVVETPGLFAALKINLLVQLKRLKWLVEHDTFDA